MNEMAHRFHALHRTAGSDILTLPNAWDALSARTVEAAGARAIATTSAGVSWSLGRPDGGGISRREAVDVVSRVARVVSVPVTADIETGYGDGSPAAVAETMRAIIAAGAVGVNIEDGLDAAGRALYEPSQQSERIAAARATADREGVDVFINARIDTFLFDVGEPAGRIANTIERARTYLSAGANGVFVPGVTDRDTIRALASSIDAPLNVMAGPGAPTVEELRELGVARVSVGPAITLAVMAVTKAAAQELLQGGTYRSLEAGMHFGEAVSLFQA